jgi:hypothetical protein
MFSNSPQSLGRWLSLAERDCTERARFNQTEALKSLAHTIGNDRRFDDYDPDRLAKAVSDHRQHGRVLDLSDPFLRKGGESRPAH